MHIGARSIISFPLALLLLLALLSFWIDKSVQPSAPKIDGSNRHDPDYIVSNFVTTQTDINGDLRYKLAAVEMRHFPDDDTTHLQKPRYTQFAVGKAYTQVEGLRGYVSSDGEEVEFVDNVKVTRQAFAGKGEMTIETDYLKIRPNEELVTTESPVIIRQAPKTVIYATGMIYQKKNRTVTLLHKVRAHYERPVIATNKTNSGVNSKIKVSDNTDAKASKRSGTNKIESNTKSITTDQAVKSSSTDTRIRRRYE
ncbi:MAG: LPS export ABC transporter periplasmic protein LptC [Methylotenera sp.]|nr:LPS export ABC transporter periplasmic protein LptC [Methylotenera sp.]MDO9232592.1 LPS export ABC transporter periplasmic protein LptC [Methylotenera sp.]MDO9388420.1 LPS export ABC transporter periplasmic protein LptC [Methylotenera sp.]MDP2102444.1 LPS export ABC transporter periplasmic protein LptC [Methylotenera sp.]MDP2281679.1 LPS export ABC transporter periplasmic protein LptC [Methylotenera sp.]